MGFKMDSSKNNKKPKDKEDEIQDHKNSNINENIENSQKQRINHESNNSSFKINEKNESQDIYSIIRDNKKSIAISFIIVFGLIFAILALSGINEVIAALRRTNLYILALTFVVQTFVYIFWALRWKLILDRMDTSPSFLNVLGILMTSVFGNNVTPGSIGGEPLRAYILNKNNDTPLEVGFASTMADRVFELLPFIIMSIVAIFALLSWDLDLGSKLFLIILIFLTFLLFTIVIYAGINKNVSKKIVFTIFDWILPLIEKITKNSYNLNKLKERAIYYIDNFNLSFTMIVENKLFFLGAFFALLTWGLDLFNSYLSFIAIGITPPLAPFITIYTIAILLSFLPLLPGSLGITEIIMITLFIPVGITPDQVLAASALERLASYIIPTIIGMFIAVYYTKSLSKNS